MTPPDLALVQDLSQTPGAMELKLRREIPAGVIEYFEAEQGWLTQKGEPRSKPYRKYLWTPEGERPVKVPSVTHICDATCPKPGVAYWSESRGIEGCVLAVKAGWVNEDSRAEDAIAIVREHGLGAEAAKNRAAKRGLNVHAINEAFLRDGYVPKLADHPAEHRGYIRSWCRMVRALKPEPVAVEQLVVHGEHGYAGRLDMRAIIAGSLETCECKTQENGALYASSYWQTALYELGAVWCGDEPAARLRAIVLPASGDWNEQQHSVVIELEAWQVDAALRWFRANRPVESDCASRNRAVRA